MTDCPAFLSITINDRLESEELFKNDLLISSCPPFFNLTFTVPTQGLLHLDKVFDIVLFDSKQEYRVFLTYLQQVNEKRVFRGSRSRVKVKPGSGKTGSDEDDGGGITKGLVFFAFVVSSSLAVVLFGVLGSLVVHLSSVLCVKREQPKNQFSNNSGVKNKASGAGGGGGGGFRSMTSLRRSVFIIYVIVRVVMTLLFTFTAFFALLALLLKRPMERIKIGANSATAPVDLGADLARAVEPQALEALEKLTGTAGGVRIACGRYVDEMAGEVLRRVEKERVHWTNMVGSDHSISARVKEAFSVGAERTWKNLRVAWQRQVRAVENQVV